MRIEHFAGVELDKELIAAQLLPFLFYMLGQGFTDGMKGRGIDDR